MAPVAQKNVADDAVEQAGGEAEAQDEQLERLGAEQGESLVEIRDFAAQSVEGAVHHAKDFAGEGGIGFEALLQCERIDLGVFGQLEDFHGHGRKTEEPAGLGGDSIKRVVRVVHG